MGTKSRNNEHYTKLFFNRNSNFSRNKNKNVGVGSGIDVKKYTEMSLGS